jgi:hypothetical protein
MASALAPQGHGVPKAKRGLPKKKSPRPGEVEGWNG